MDAKAIAKHVEALEVAVRIAQQVFTSYAQHHDLKGTPEGDGRAQANRRLAERMAQALRGEIP